MVSRAREARPGATADCPSIRIALVISSLIMIPPFYSTNAAAVNSDLEETRTKSGT